MPDPRDTVTLPAHCMFCHGRVILHFLDWPTEPGSRSMIPFSGGGPWPRIWACPYCQTDNADTSPGRLAQVTRREVAGGHAESLGRVSFGAASRGQMARSADETPLLRNRRSLWLLSPQRE